MNCFRVTQKAAIGRKNRLPTPVKEEDDDPYTFKDISEETPSRKSPGRPGRKPRILSKLEEKSFSSDESSNNKKDNSEMNKSRLNKDEVSSDTESKKFQDEVKVEPGSDDDEETIQIERVDTPPPRYDFYFCFSKNC